MILYFLSVFILRAGEHCYIDKQLAFLSLIKSSVEITKIKKKTKQKRNNRKKRQTLRVLVEESGKEEEREKESHV